jgi:transketolase
MRRDGPTVLVLSRQNLDILARSQASGAGVAQGAYVLGDAEGGRPDVILIGSGAEVGLCVKARERLRSYGVAARVVSMPSWDLFEAQDAGYRAQVLPPDIRARVAVEAGSPIGWERYAGSEGAVIGIDRFGASAPGEELMRRLGFTEERVAAAALRLIGRDAEARQLERNATTGETAVAPTAPSEGHS